MKYDLIDKQIGLLTIIKDLTPMGMKNFWLVRCACGKEWGVRTDRLTKKIPTRGCRSCMAKYGSSIYIRQKMIEKENKNG